MALVQRIRQAWDATVDLIERAARPVDWRFFSSYGEPNAEKVLTSFDEYARRAYGGNAAVHGIINAQLRLFAEARFRLRDADKKLHDHECLHLLEHPWPNGTTGDLLARMRQDATLAGNAYVRRVGDGQLERLRPDWVTIVSWVRDGTSEGQETPDGRQLREVIGFLYEPLGDTEREPEFYPVEEVAHWAPTPDPMANWRGMSPITPAIKEINADLAMTEHRDKFFRNAATPNLILKYANKLGPEQRNRIRDAVAARHGGPSNAGGTLVLDEGADPMIVGSQFRDSQFDEVMAAGENRIAVALGVPAIVAGLKQGQDAAAWSMYKQALRAFGDVHMRPDWRSVCAALAAIVDVPEGMTLWYDTSDISALQEGEQEQAAVLQTQLAAISTAITAGFKPDTATAAVIAGDLALLEHTGMVSVQMHDPTAPPPEAAGAGDPAAAGDDVDEDDQADEDEKETRRAQLLDLLDEILRAWDPDLHPRDRRGRFRRIGAGDLLDGSVPVGKLPDRRLEQLHSEFANDPTVNHNAAVFHLLGDEMDRRDQLAAYRRLVDSVPDAEGLRELPEDDVMRLYAEVSAVNDERDLDRAAFDRIGAELERREGIERADREAPARAYLARDLSTMSDDELATAYDHAAALDDTDERNRVAGEMLRREEADRAAAEAEQAAAAEAERQRIEAEQAEARAVAEAMAKEAAERERLLNLYRGFPDGDLEGINYRATLGIKPVPSPLSAEMARHELARRKAAREDGERRNRWFRDPVRGLTDDDLRDAIEDHEADGYNTNDRRRARLAELLKEHDRRQIEREKRAAMMAELPTTPAKARNPLGKVGQLESYLQSFRDTPAGRGAAARLADARRKVYGLDADADDKAIAAARKADPRSPSEKAAMELAMYRHLAKFDESIRRNADGTARDPEEDGWASEADGPAVREPLPPANVAKAWDVWEEIKDQAIGDQQAGDESTGQRFNAAMARALGLPDNHTRYELGNALRADEKLRTKPQRGAAYLAEFRQLAKEQGVDPSDRLRYGPPDRATRKPKATAAHRESDPAKDAEVDRLMAGGRDFIDAYAEVYGLDADRIRREESAAVATGGTVKGGTRAALRKAYDEHVHAQYLEAEKATRGNLLSPSAKQRNARAARGSAVKAIDPLALFSGPRKYAEAHASEELLRFWARHPRMTFAEYMQHASGHAGAATMAAAAAGGNEYA